MSKNTIPNSARNGRFYDSALKAFAYWNEHHHFESWKSEIIQNSCLFALLLLISKLPSVISPWDFQSQHWCQRKGAQDGHVGLDTKHHQNFSTPGNQKIWDRTIKTSWMQSSKHMLTPSTGIQTAKMRNLTRKWLRCIQKICGYGYGSIPINTIFSGMNIHLPAILMFTRGTIGFDPSPYVNPADLVLGAPPCAQNGRRSISIEAEPRVMWAGTDSISAIGTNGGKQSCSLLITVCYCR